ncbi:MAG: hypothetical protein U0360_06240 [Dehalococcoidia bacterium]
MPSPPGALALGGGAFARYAVALDAPPSALASMSGVHALEGAVRADPSVRGTFVRFDVDVDRLDGSAIVGVARVTAPFSSSRPRGGDRVALTGRVEAIRPSMTAPRRVPARPGHRCN